MDQGRNMLLSRFSVVSGGPTLRPRWPDRPGIWERSGKLSLCHCQEGRMQNQNEHSVSRRSLLKRIGASAGGAAMYQAMVEMGYAATSDFTGPIKLSGDVKGASVLVLGAGLAGMTAAYELRKAGYRVQVLEYNDRPGGRNWSLYGGDRYTD